MKKTQKFSYFLMGVIVTMLITSMAVPALAALTSKTIQVSTGVNLYLDDNKFVPKDANGNQVEVFVYNGTTYLPARAISEAVGLPVQWDGATSSVYIGKHSSETPAVYIQDLTTFTGKGWYTSVSEQDNMGNTWYNVAYCNDTNVYKINGQYTSIKGTLFQYMKYKNTTNEGTLSIYGDGKLLYTAVAKSGVEPISFSVDLTGVLELKVVFNGKITGQNYADSGISNFGLYT